MSWLSGLAANIMHKSWRLSGGLIDGLLGTNFVGDYDAARNYDLQKANLKWQKYVQEQTWNREDNAVQRRVEDYRGAGMNPLLAAGGQAASSGAVVSTTAPYRETAKYTPLEKLAMSENINKTIAETLVQGEVAENLKEQNKNLQAQNELTKAQTIKTIADATGWDEQEVAFKLFGFTYNSKTKTPRNNPNTPKNKMRENVNDSVDLLFHGRSQ